MHLTAERAVPRHAPAAPSAGPFTSHRWRVFLIAWILFSVHFATNIVREHYPAFSLVENGTFRVDEYQGFHSDIFVHIDGHSVIGNQVFVSVLAAVPLLVFDPVLDAIQAYSLRRLAAQGVPDGEYRTDKPNRVAFFRVVRERGLDLRFGAATVVTSVFFMAPITAWFLVLLHGVLVRRGVAAGRAAALALLFGFGTPIFFRTAHLNHNMFVMYAMFIAYVLLWLKRDDDGGVPLRYRIWAGFFGGITIATDYIGVIILPLLYGYLLLNRLPSAGWRRAFRESLAFVAGTIPPILFLWYSQWAMYGNPFLPGQHWMPDQNEYTELGMRGFTLPAPDLIVMNLFHDGYGLFSWGPLFLLALIPVARANAGGLILPRRERVFVLVTCLALLLFSSANQYARLQWNSGVRYLVPLMPFIFLALADVWLRLGTRARVAIGAIAVLHAWVLTVFREPVIASWRLLLAEGVQLPWLRVWRMTSNPPVSTLTTQLASILILAVTLGLCWFIWRRGERAEAAARAL